jgi:hypothetical protein
MAYPESSLLLAVRPGLTYVPLISDAHPQPASEVCSDVPKSGEVRWYQNGGEAIDLSRIMGHLGSTPLGVAFGGPEPEEQPSYMVVKYGVYVPYTEPTETYEPVKLTRYQRARRLVRNTVADWRLRLGERVAGVKLTDGDDW